ncbi:MAG: Fur family transcriptional regulator [Ilumatobacteraceae bacterium]
MAGVNAHDVAAQRLEAIKQRYSMRRRRLVEALLRSPHPLVATDIVDTEVDLPQSTVYRNLAVLEAAGVVVKVLTNGDRAAFELAEDLKGHHHHLVCMDCGTVLDIDIPAEVERTLEEGMKSVAERTGFTVLGHRLDLTGRCRNCASSAR